MSNFTVTTTTYDGPGGRRVVTRTARTGDPGSADRLAGLKINDRSGIPPKLSGFARPKPVVQGTGPTSGSRAAAAALFSKPGGGTSAPRRHYQAPVKQPMSANNGEGRNNTGWGSPAPSTPQKPGGGKRFQEIRAQCLREGRLFEDPDFPAVDESIYYNRGQPRQYVWKRPSELVDSPQLFVGGASRFDVKQGELGNCWLVAAVASLCGHEKLLYRVVPRDQGFSSRDQYAGIFHLQFWQYGNWTDVIIDDLLPTYKGRLVFMHSNESNEFWSPLLEKAYAKLMGSYQGLQGGCISEALEDFTGGVTEVFDFREKTPDKLFGIMLKAYERSSLMGCSIEAMPGKMEAELANGLIMGHAYSITSVKLVDIIMRGRQVEIRLVRIRNPWGNEHEWNGAWSDKSAEWNLLDETKRKYLGLTFEDDGEFWMSFEDFSRNFEKLQICHLGPDSFVDAASKKRWESTVHHGTWKKRVTAGGCVNHRDTFWTNPQYHVEVIDPDDFDDDETGTIVLGLMQKERRAKRKEGLDLLTMGYSIYKMDDPHSEPKDMNFFKYNASVAKSPAFINMREVCGRHKLVPGHYFILPSTFDPHHEGEFLLRIFSEKPANSEEIDEETKIADVQPQPRISAEDCRQEEKLTDTFKRIAGEDLEIDANELQGLLNATFRKEFTFDGFSLDACRSMVAMMDVDKSGKLGFEEFKTLWNDLRTWKGVFKQHDKDNNGTFDSIEMREALHAVGFKVSNATYSTLIQRYTDINGTMYFDDFIQCIVRMKTMFDIFGVRKTGTKAEFTLDQFIQTTMYS